MKLRVGINNNFFENYGSITWWKSGEMKNSGEKRENIEAIVNYKRH